MKNPLRRRYLRELRADFGKYMVIFLLMILSISEISGFLVCDESMISAYRESFTKYNIEDGNFTVESELKARQISAIEEAGVTVYPLYFTDRLLTNGTTMRMFSMRDAVDLPCLMEGALPEKSDEIAIDRMYADNNGLKVGDTLSLEEKTDSGEAAAGTMYRISGLVALSDYSALFENNNDTMFDAKQFGVSVVTKEAFQAFDRDLLTWRYAWKYDTPPADETEENERAEAFVKILTGAVDLTGFLPRYQNQAITFTGEDMGSDRAMMTIFLYIVIIIIAFVFAVTISNTIVKEAAVIGTLRATGFTRNELIRHYMTLPVIVTLISAAVGNLFGYTVMKNINASLYYGSYSLPTYVTRWNADAFLETTVVPLILMAVITWWVLHRRLKLSPLQFLRRDLQKSRRGRAFPLSKRIPFFSRFRLRIAAQNRNNYIVLAIGILFANFLLMFGLMFPNVLHNYMDALPENMFCKYQYVLQLPAGALNEDRKLESLLNMMLFRQAVETDNPDAEKFSAYSLRTVADARHPFKEEELLVYGVEEESRYLNQEFRPGEVYVSSAYAEKWMLEKGSSITLKEPYEDRTYAFTVDGIYNYDGALAVFMEREDMNTVFDLGTDTFSGYFSATEITDIDEKYIGQRIDFDALSKVSRQLMISMGSMMNIVDVFSVIMFIVLIYLMSKMIIEKNAASISMTKILGYRNGEIARLYVMVTSILVVLFLAVTIPVESVALQWVFRMMLRTEMTGWIPFVISKSVYRNALLTGIGTYAAVALLEYRRISRVPMDEALKNVE
ncbi:MAG: ABC transporter permease [Eubacterium sp.]|nr:ABC transporter permease [Eubacterium sp.]